MRLSCLFKYHIIANIIFKKNIFNITSPLSLYKKLSLLLTLTLRELLRGKWKLSNRPRTLLTQYFLNGDAPSTYIRKY